MAAQDGMKLNVGWSYDRASALATADTLQDQAQAFRRLADGLERAALAIRDSVQDPGRRTEPGSYAPADAMASLPGGILGLAPVGVYVDEALPPDTAVLISDPGPGEAFDPARHAAVITETGDETP